MGNGQWAADSRRKDGFCRHFRLSGSPLLPREFGREGVRARGESEGFRHLEDVASTQRIHLNSYDSFRFHEAVVCHSVHGTRRVPRLFK